MKYREELKLNLNDVDYEYCKLVKDILENGYDKCDRTGTGTKSLYGRQIRFNMKDSFPLLTQKKLHLKSIIHELLWFLQGDTNIKYLNDNGVTIWNEWADENGDLGPVYGKQWVSLCKRDDYTISKIDGKPVYFEVDTINQIQNIIDRLNTVPDCRRMIVSAWTVHDLPDMALMPCHYGFQVYTRELDMFERWEIAGLTPNMSEIDYCNKFCDKMNVPKREISLMWNQRSVDTGLGLPFNIASYGLLLEMIAQQTNMIAGELIGNLGDVHIYDNHIEPIKEHFKRDSKKCSPKLVLNKADDIFSYKYEDFKIVGYDAHSSIKMKISV